MEIKDNKPAHVCCQSIPWHDSFLLVVDYRSELVRCGLRADSRTRKIPLEEVLDECGFPRRVLPHQHYDRKRFEVDVIHAWRIEFWEVIHNFQGLHLVLVNAFNSFNNRQTLLDHLARLR